ncbi:UNVERIFIED_CONTAM: hypothetical protein RMT77_010168 [Armadillidium vulgare]
MLRIVAVCVLFLSAEVFGNPSTKKPESKFPKKYSKEFLLTDKVKIKDQYDGSYNNYKVSGPTDPIDLPPIYYDFYSVLENPEGEVPSDYIVPPGEDSYSVYEDKPAYSLIVPKSDVHLIKKYLGYTFSNGELTDSLRAPQESSYSEVQLPKDELILTDFQPPKPREETIEEPESSYLSFESPQQAEEPIKEEPESSYLNYDSASSSYSSNDTNVNETELTSMRPPPETFF